MKHPTHRARAARARAKYTFYRFYTVPCCAPRTTTADLGISIHLFFWFLRRVPMRLHAFTELAKHKGFGICVMYSEPLPMCFHIKSDRYSLHVEFGGTFCVTGDLLCKAILNF